MPCNSQAMQFDSKYTWLLGGFFCGALTCYVVQALYAQKEKKRIKPFKGFYIDYNFNFDLGKEEEQKITLIFDSTNNRAFIASESNNILAMNSKQCKKQPSGEYKIACLKYGHDKKFFIGDILFDSGSCLAKVLLEVTYDDTKKKTKTTLKLPVNGTNADL